MLHICHFASGDGWAGTEAHLAGLLPELARRPGLTVHTILLNDGLLAQRLRENHLRVSVFPENRLSAFDVVKAVTRLLHETHTDLLHTHGYKQNILGTIAGRLAYVAWLVRTEHGVYETLPGWAGFRMRIYQSLNTLAARWCSAILTVSNDLAKQWQSRYGTHGPKVAVVRNGVPLSKKIATQTVSLTRSRLALKEGQVLIGTLGRLVPIKGLKDLLEAAALLHGRETRCVFLIAGDGPLRASLEAHAADLNLQHVVHFLGFTSEPADVLAALDVFVLPSLGEGVPMALLEALALGKPVVATSVGGVAELLSSGVDALLVRPGAPVELAQACEQLVVDTVLREQLGRQARLLAEEQLSTGRMATEVHDLYCQLMEQSSSSEKYL